MALFECTAAGKPEGTCTIGYPAAAMLESPKDEVVAEEAGQ